MDPEKSCFNPCGCGHLRIGENHSVIPPKKEGQPLPTYKLIKGLRFKTTTPAKYRCAKKCNHVGIWLGGGFKHCFMFTPTWGNVPNQLFFQMGWNHPVGILVFTHPYGSHLFFCNAVFLGVIQLLFLSFSRVIKQCKCMVNWKDFSWKFVHCLGW